MARGRSISIRRQSVRAGKPSGTRAHLVTTIQGGGVADNPLSASQSTIAADAWTLTGDGVDTQTLTATWRLLDGSVAPGRAVTWTVERTFVDAGECTLTADVAEIEGTVGSATLTLFVYNAAGTPLPGIPTASIVFSSNGAGATFEPVDSETNQNGRYRVTFSATGVEVHTISVTIKGLAVTATVDVEVTGEAPALPTIDWFSDFSTETGTDPDAYTDGGKWNEAAAPNGGLTVVDAEDEEIEGWPSTNALEVVAQSSSTGYHRIHKSGLGGLDEDSDFYLRFYFNYRLRAGHGDDNNHPIEGPDVPNIIRPNNGEQWTFNARSVDETHWRPQFRSVSESDMFSLARAYYEGPDLEYDTTYRVELHIRRLTGDSMNFHARIFERAANGTESQVADDSDFVSSNGQPGTLADHPTLTSAWPDCDGVDQIFGGLNGLAASSFPQPYAYEGCFAVSRETWCGAYDAVNG